MIEWLFDGVLALSLVILAIGALYARHAYTGVLLFVAFGLILSLVWARLGAPDLALAEAAIGAGLTGAMLFLALGKLPGEMPAVAINARRLIPALVLFGAALALLLRAVWPLPEGRVLLPDEVERQLAGAGVEHPVTAVLLNFRSWDTLLELAVLLSALVGVRQLAVPRFRTPRPWPLLIAWGCMLAPLSVLMGGYILWRGASAPGGAFQAGALLASGAVVLRLIGLLPPLRWRYWWLRLSVLGAMTLFLVVGMLMLMLGRNWLDYPFAWSKELIVLIELAATVSIATTLTLLVVGEKEELQ